MVWFLAIHRLKPTQHLTTDVPVLVTNDNKKQTKARRARRVSAGVTAHSLVTVWIVEEMSHGQEGVVEDTGRNGPVLGVDQQHAPQQRHKLPAVWALRLHVAVVRSQHQVHLDVRTEGGHVQQTHVLAVAWRHDHSVRWHSRVLRRPDNWRCIFWLLWISAPSLSRAHLSSEGQGGWRGKVE